jgi:hypothetical protein
MISATLTKSLTSLQTASRGLGSPLLSDFVRRGGRKQQSRAGPTAERRHLSSRIAAFTLA